MKVIILKMDKVCAVVDAQGYYIRGRFYAREAAFVSDTIGHCQEFNPNIRWSSLTKKEEGSIYKVRSKIHALSLNVFKNKQSIIPPAEHMINYLKTFHKMLATEEKPYVAVKNKWLKDELEKAEIPYIDLDDSKYGFPSINEIEKLYNNTWLCSYHCKVKPRRQDESTFKCASRKCYNLWHYIKAYKAPLVQEMQE